MFQTTRTQIAAFFFSVAVALWTIAPLCGTPPDVNPEACCRSDSSCDSMKGNPVNASDCCHVKENGRAGLGTSTWYAMPGGRWHLTPAGFWYVFVSIPILQFILLRWYLRLFIWFRFLWQVSRI